jgi:hypothetical protein
MASETDDAGDPLPLWGDGELNHDWATNDVEVDCIGSSGGELTTDADGVNVIVVGDGETNASLGDGVQDHDRAYDDGEVDRTESGDGERTNGASGVNVIVVGDRKTNGSLGDGG